MQHLPKQLTDFGHAYNLMKNVISYKILMAALELGLFDYFETPHTVEEAVAELRLNASATPIMLDLLQMTGLLTKAGDRYHNTCRAAQLFVKTQPFNIIPLMCEMDKMLITHLPDITLVVQNGPQLNIKAAASEETWAEATHSGACWAFHGIAETVSRAAAKLPGFSGFRHILDLGGGHGVFSLYMAEKNPELKITVFDRPTILKVAQEYIERFGLQNQISTCGGDYLTDDIGTSYDLILASCTLNFTLLNNSLDKVMAKIYDALKPGGYFISLHEAWQRDATTAQLGPEFEHLAYGLLIGQRMTFEENELADSMLKVGFRSVHSRYVPSSAGEMCLEIACK